MEKSVGMLSRAFGGLVEYWRPFAVEEADEVTARKTCAVGRIILRDFILSINLQHSRMNYEVKRNKGIYLHSFQSVEVWGKRAGRAYRLPAACGGSRTLESIPLPDPYRRTGQPIVAPSTQVTTLTLQ